MEEEEKDNGFFQTLIEDDLEEKLEDIYEEIDEGRRYLDYRRMLFLDEVIDNLNQPTNCEDFRDDKAVSLNIFIWACRCVENYITVEEIEYIRNHTGYERLCTGKTAFEELKNKIDYIKRKYRVVNGKVDTGKRREF